MCSVCIGPLVYIVHGHDDVEHSHLHDERLHGSVVGLKQRPPDRDGECLEGGAGGA